MKTYLIMCLVIIISTLSLACSTPAYLEGQSIDNNESIIDEDINDKYSFLKAGNYRYATNNKGLFYISVGSNNISYYDYSSGKSTIWCNKIACKHEDKSCSAYVGNQFELEYVECYNGYVYKMDSDDNGMYLVRLNEDGTGEVRMSNLLEGYPTGVSIDFGRVFDGKMYYFVKKDNQQIDINNVDLTTKDSITHIFSLDSSDLALSAFSMFVNEQSIYLSLSRTTDNGKSYSRKIFCYDRNNQLLTELATS
ncbi:MAG: hypothetical protein Q4F11_04805, partial [Eubacteriales bacterium]|nr:hypothetical protein [Eubacteriales bacterium]